MTDLTPVKLAYKLYEPDGQANDNLCPVIFLHGLTSSKETWSNFTQTTANRTRRKVYAIDARNHGESECTENFNFNQNVVDLLHFMDNIQAQKAILVGHSMGGITAIQVALQKPERVEKLIVEDMFIKKCPKHLLDPVASFISLWILTVSSIPKHLEPEQATTFALDFMYSLIPPGINFLTPKEKMRRTVGKELIRKADGGYDVKFNKSVVLSALRNPSTLMSEPSGQFNGPALFIYGEMSPFGVGKEEENIKKHCPKAELIEFKEATHSIHVEFPEKFLETILSFIL